MPKAARFYSANFMLRDGSSYESILPEYSKQGFISRYANFPNSFLIIESIKHLDHQTIELSADCFTPVFIVPSLNLTFSEGCNGYEYLTRYFAEFCNQLKQDENDLLKQQEDYYRNTRDY